MNHRTKILSVDDDEDLAANLNSIPEAEGYDTEIVTNGKNAIAVCSNKSFDLGLIDMKLPSERTQTENRISIVS